jgi:glycine/D-amino acid oxidase-like deaminating enzyme
MRVIVVGAGLAGTLLAWRLRGRGADVVLVGPPGRPGRETGSDRGVRDATAASGGLVRAFETDAAVAALALASLAELYEDARLRRWSEYRELGSVYLLDGAASPCPPDGAVLLSGGEVERRFGFAGLPEGTVGVYEPRAGYLSPHRLRTSVLARLPQHDATPVEHVDPAAVVRLRDGRSLDGDAVVLAAGAWTPAMVAASGLPATPTSLTTKHIQYTVCRVDGPELASFVDETTGLYGRADRTGHALLGLPSTQWGVDPAHAVPDPVLADRVLEVAAERLPGCRPRPVGEPVAASDCYVDPPGLALRALAGNVYTFTGGSGGAAKTALAASTAAAAALLGAPSHLGGR